MKDLLNLRQALGRSEMKKLMAGSGDNGDGLCCYCWTPGGFEPWCRTDTYRECESICEEIYPAYDPSEVGGNWQTGGTDCSTC